MPPAASRRQARSPATNKTWLGITVAQVQAAINDRANTYEDIAALAALSPGVKKALAVRD